MQGLLIHETTRQAFPLEGVSVLGRSSDSSIQVTDPSISRRHAMIRRQTDGFHYFDLGSFNGSYLNGVRVTTSRKLCHGDDIALGDQIFRFEQIGETDAAGNTETSTLAQVRSVDALLLVSDIQGFTKISEKLTPEQLAPIIGSWYSETEQILASHGATLDKFVGDSVLAYWTDTSFETRKKAFRTAGALHSAMTATYQTHRKLLASLGLNFTAGTAIHLGIVAYGGMSAHEFTILGDAVNVVFRLESLTRETGYNLHTSAEVLRDWPEGHRYCTHLGPRTVRNRQAPVDIWVIREIPGAAE